MLYVRIQHPVRGGSMDEWIDGWMDGWMDGEGERTL